MSGAAPHHVDQIRKLDQETGLPVWSPEEYQGLMSRPDILFQVALAESGTLIGFCITLLSVTDAEIVKIAVSPDWQGRGIGRRLLMGALGFGRQHGCDACFLEVRPSNSRAQQFYRRHGFEIIGRRKDYYVQPREDALVMRFVLKQPGRASGPKPRRLFDV